MFVVRPATHGLLGVRTCACIKIIIHIDVYGLYIYIYTHIHWCIQVQYVHIDTHLFMSTLHIHSHLGARFQFLLEHEAVISWGACVRMRE